MTAYQCPSEEVTSIVIDTGSSWTRAGFSGENSPRHIVPTVYGKDGKDQYYFGDDGVNDVHEGKEIYSPMIDGCVQDWNAISRLWKWVYDDKLQVDPTEFPLVTTEQVWNPIQNKQRALEVAFEDLQVPLFSLVKSPLCVAYEYAQANALVVDIGSSVVSVTPIIEGTILHKCSVHSRFAGDFLNSHILLHMQNLKLPLSPQYMIEEKAHVEPGQSAQPKLKTFPEGCITQSYDVFQLQRVLNNFKESTLQVSETPLNVTPQHPPPPTMNRPFEFPTGYNMTFGPERLVTTEPLFAPASYPLPGVTLPEGSQNQGLANLLYSALSRAPNYVSGPHSAPSEVTTSLLSNIILTGGTAQLNGLVPRIEREISAWVNNYRPTINLPERPHGSWAGASIIGSMCQFDQNYWVSKADYEEFGSNIAEKRFK